MTDGAILTASDLHFSYTESPFIRGVSLTVKPGSTTAIVGPNGAGKTTLIRLLAGLLKGHSGEIRFREQSVSSYSRKELGTQLAFIPSEVSAPFAYSVYEIVEMGRYVHMKSFALKSDLDRRAIDEALRLTSMGRFVDQPFTTLSSGEQQRAVIARSLAQEPLCLLMDEPTAHLDLHYQIEIHRLLRRLADEKGTTIVFISHDLNLAAACADEIVLMNSGKIVLSGKPRDVIDVDRISEIYGVSLRAIKVPGQDVPLIHPIL